jgi:BASS family bile acid:Na+ symporter
MFSSYNTVDVLINSVLAFIMLGLGLSLTASSFKNIFLHPKPLTVALALQVIGLPIISFTIAYFSGLQDEIKVGIVIVSVCASGASSNLVTHLFKGNVALAISMTVLNSIITLISIPLIVNLALMIFLGYTTEIRLPVFDTMLQIFVISILPASIGVIIRKYWPEFAKSLENPLKVILTLLLGLVFTLKIFLGEKSGGSGILFKEILEILPFVLLLNILAMALGFYGSRLFKVSFTNQFTTAIEVGLHNTALALLISGTILNETAMEKPAIVYAMFSFFTAILFTMIIKMVYKSGEKAI